MTTYKIGMRYTVKGIECEDYELVDAESLISAVQYVEDLIGYVIAHGRAFSVEEISADEIDADIIANTYYVYGRPEA